VVLDLAEAHEAFEDDPDIDASTFTAASHRAFGLPTVQDAWNARPVPVVLCKPESSRSHDATRSRTRECS
jgi:hypothetical protein